MSVEILPRDRGAVIRCGNGAFEGCPPCSETLQTGQIQAGLIRSYAQSIGWGKSEVDGFRRIDLCPDHMAADAVRTQEPRRVRCGHPECVASFLATSTKSKRDQAKRAGWGRASKKGRGQGAKAHDLCPAHLAEEHRRVASIAPAKKAA